MKIFKSTESPKKAFFEILIFLAFGIETRVRHLQYLKENSLQMNDSLKISTVLNLAQNEKAKTPIELTLLGIEILPIEQSLKAVFPIDSSSEWLENLIFFRFEQS